MTQLKAYKNELIAGIAFLLLMMAFVYKQGKVSGQTDTSAGTALQELQEVISLKKIWGDKKTTKKVDKLKAIVAPSKVKWSRKSKKLTASFTNLSNQELNRVIVKIMNLAVEIQRLEVKKLGASYHVEFKCKW
jgi:hypothetical protein